MSDNRLHGSPEEGERFKQKNKRRSLRLTVVAALAFTVIFALAGCASAITEQPKNEAPEIQVGAVRAPADYQELYAAIDEVNSSQGGYFGLSAGGAQAAEDGASAPLAALEAPAADYAAESSSSSLVSPLASSDYTKTNVQVEGIDEGDIIKTDGNCIYMLSNNELIIFKPEGASTKELSRTALVTQTDEYSYNYSSELYISGTTAAVISNEYSSTPLEGLGLEALSATDSYSYGFGQTWTTVVFYDVSNPNKPERIQSFGQSGDYVSSRLQGDVLYLISRYWLYNAMDDDVPATYVPLLKEGDTPSAMAASDIRIMPSIESVSYTVVTSLDVSTAQRLDQKSVLGEASTVYMSHDNLYLGSTIYSEEVKEPYEESVYTIEEHISKQTTQLIRVGIDNGSLDVAVQCTVDGSLLNQFSLDEYEGNLRLVVTLNDYSYKILRDESHQVESYQQNEANPTTNALYVLNPSLETIGSVKGLAEDEQIYSARFDGEIGYMVTYRQMDPLFAIDLSNPADPKVTSELKIPGFSTYLHPFGEGRLLGLGYDTNGTVRDGMKLSMFDISDPYDVTELSAKSVDTSYSEALDNHKAVLVDIERNIIGFPGDGSKAPLYFIYAYDEEDGFELQVALELSVVEDYYYYGYYGIRGLIIGEDLYVSSGNFLDVFDLEDYSKLATLQVQSASEPGGFVEPMPLMID
jgi:uncharacterized secreted protein with C-terminal beta-propeller domain